MYFCFFSGTENQKNETIFVLFFKLSVVDSYVNLFQLKYFKLIIYSELFTFHLFYKALRCLSY